MVRIAKIGVRSFDLPLAQPLVVGGRALTRRTGLLVIVEDGAFVGSRVVIVEGVRVGREAVIGTGVVLISSTPVIVCVLPTANT